VVADIVCRHGLSVPGTNFTTVTSLHPAAAGLDYLAEIAAHSAGLADAAESNLDAPVEHCPGWTVADLVGHVLQVHWFWGLIAEQRLAEPPDIERPEPPTREALVSDFRAGARRLIEILRSADQDEPVWTWAPTQQNIAFISRHQVQEAAVHRWDAEHAAGRQHAFEVPVSVDSIEEFLTFSVSSASDHPDQPRPDLGGRLVLSATDADAAWTILDGELPGTVRFTRQAQSGAPAVTGTASDLMLWLYQRVELPVAAGADGRPADELVTRFRALTFTD
jgi:uncharacterized protein (TIGR03083 family)